MSGRPEFTPTGRGPIGQVGASPTGKVEGQARSTFGRLVEHVDDLRAQLDAARRDVERLDWIERRGAELGIDGLGWFVRSPMSPGSRAGGDTVREAIDSAMRLEEGR